MEEGIGVFKLVTGDEIISKFQKNENDVLLTKPLVFNVVPDYQSGQHRVGLSPMFISNPEAECTIRNEHIISSIDANTELQVMYIRQTTGLEVPSGIVT